MDADYKNLSGPQRAALRAALLDAFTRSELMRLLSDRLDKNWDDYAREGGTREDQLFDVIEASRRDGWIQDLVQQAKLQRPNNSQIARLDVTLGLLAPTPSPAGADAQQPHTVLERFITTSAMKDFSDFVGLQGKICRVKAGGFLGTGFLIADDLVLTNYHVVERELRGDGRSITCIFDLSTNGKPGGRNVSLSSDWLVAASPYAAGDGAAGGAPPTSEQLDFAILRLAEPVGTELINGVARGSIALNTSASAIDDHVVFILQYPPNRPLSMSAGTVIGYDSQKIRLRYAASTEKGSSGSPVFSSELALVALHQAGDPDWSRAAEFNQGVPTELIAAWLAKNGTVLKPSGENVEPTDPIAPPPDPKVGSIVLLAEPKPPTPAEASLAMTGLRQLLAARGAAVSEWTEGWRDVAPFSATDGEQLLRARPAFVRTIVDPSKSFSAEFDDLTYKLHRRFGLELDDERPLKNLLLEAPRILWRPGGAPWTGTPPAQAAYARNDTPESLTQWLTQLLGLQAPDAQTVIHCEYPTYDSDAGIQIRKVVEQGLIQAIGNEAEPDRQVFAPGRLRDVLKDMPSTGLNIFALNDMSAPEPATRTSAIDIFRRSDRDIDAAVGGRSDVIRIAVLVRTADQFNGELEFNAKARLRNWYLLRIPRCDQGSYAYDQDNVRFIQQQVSAIRSSRLQAKSGPQ